MPKRALDADRVSRRDSWYHPPSRRRPSLVGSHYSVSALILVVGAIPPPSFLAVMVVAVVAVLVVV
jgi:hypothetical protein